MDYSGKILTTVDISKINSLALTDDICQQYLEMSAQDLASDLDMRHDFDDLSCDMVDDEYYISTANKKRFIELLQWIADTYQYCDTACFFAECGVDNKVINRIEFLNESKKSLYESIMKSISKEVKKALNEMAVIGKDRIDQNISKSGNYRNKLIDEVLTLVDEIYNAKDTVTDVIDTYKYMHEVDSYIPEYLEKHVSDRLYKRKIHCAGTCIYCKTDDSEYIMIGMPEEFKQNLKITTTRKIFDNVEDWSKMIHWNLYDNYNITSFENNLTVEDFELISTNDIRYLVEDLTILLTVIHGCNAACLR